MFPGAGGRGAAGHRVPGLFPGARGPRAAAVELHVAAAAARVPAAVRGGHPPEAAGVPAAAPAGRRPPAAGAAGGEAALRGHGGPEEGDHGSAEAAAGPAGPGGPQGAAPRGGPARDEAPRRDNSEGGKPRGLRARGAAAVIKTEGLLNDVIACDTSLIGRNYLSLCV